MPVISHKRISDYISGFARTPSSASLLKTAFGNVLKNDKRYSKHIQSLSSLRKAMNGNVRPNLQKRFSNEFLDSSSKKEQWYVFEPDESLTRILQHFSAWLEDEMHKIPELDHPAIQSIIRNKLTKINSIDDALLMTKSSLISPQKLKTALNQRRQTKEEQNNNLKYICRLSSSAELFQIISPTGMINVGKLAKNCLGSKTYPRKGTPHRYRVKEPEKWLYFTVRDDSNRSLFSVLVERKYGKIESAGNGRMDNGQSPPVPDQHWDIYKMAQKEIVCRYPDILRNVTPGSSRHRVFVDSGFYDLNI